MQCKYSNECHLVYKVRTAPPRNQFWSFKIVQNFVTKSSFIQDELGRGYLTKLSRYKIGRRLDVHLGPKNLKIGSLVLFLWIKELRVHICLLDSLKFAKIFFSELTCWNQPNEYQAKYLVQNTTFHFSVLQCFAISVRWSILHYSVLWILSTDPAPSSYISGCLSSKCVQNSYMCSSLIKQFKSEIVVSFMFFIEIIHTH